MNTIDASIVILTKNGGANFPRLLARIFSQQFKGNYEVIVIDSGSSDGTVEAARQQSVRIYQIESRQFHHSRTRNLGAELSQGQYIVYITQDALPLDNGWLQKLTDNFAMKNAAMVVGKQIPWENTKPPEKFFYHYSFPKFKVVVQSGATNDYHDNIFISDVNSAYRREILLQYRFAEDIVMAEDKEIAARIIQGGQSIIYEPDACVYHAHVFSIRDVFRRNMEYGIAIRQGAYPLPALKKPAYKRILEYLIAEIKYLKASHSLWWLPYTLIYESSRCIGFLMGKAGLSMGKEGMTSD